MAGTLELSLKYGELGRDATSFSLVADEALVTPRIYHPLQIIEMKKSGLLPEKDIDSLAELSGAEYCIKGKDLITFNVCRVPVERIMQLNGMVQHTTSEASSGFWYSIYFETPIPTLLEKGFLRTPQKVTGELLGCEFPAQ